MSTCLALLPKPPVPAEHNPAPPLYYDDFVALADKAWRACKTAFGSSPPPSLLTSPPTHPEILLFRVVWATDIWRQGILCGQCIFL